MLREIDNVFLPTTGVLCPVYEIFSRSKDEASSTLLRTLPHYKEGLAAYRAKRWMTAIDCFQKLVDASADQPSRAMVRHCQYWAQKDVGSYWDTSWGDFGDEDQY